MSYSIQVDNKKEFILILGEGPTQRLSCGKKHSINFNKSNKSFVCVYHVMEQIVIRLLTVQKLLSSKQKILEF